jgi:hypothetical protein
MSTQSIADQYDARNGFATVEQKENLQQFCKSLMSISSWKYVVATTPCMPPPVLMLLLHYIEASSLLESVCQFQRSSNSQHDYAMRQPDHCTANTIRWPMFHTSINHVARFAALSEPRVLVLAVKAVRFAM